MKYLVLLLVVGVALAWLSIARRRSRGERGGAPGAGRRAGAHRSEPTAMLACVHCGVHLPRPEALFDAAGRPYCSEAHRLAGPL
ncbi:MAG: hypothetical protein AMXMBFR66_22660 [Pseudomonadota bacterium]|nr:hypothetical protein [Rubrivivax sp.]